MPWNWSTQPTGEFKFEAGTQSPNGKAITLKGVRAIELRNFPGAGSASDEDDALEFNSALSTFFNLFGLSLPSTSTVSGFRGVRTEKNELRYISS